VAQRAGQVTRGERDQGPVVPRVGDLEVLTGPGQEEFGRRQAGLRAVHRAHGHMGQRGGGQRARLPAASQHRAGRGQRGPRAGAGQRYQLADRTPMAFRIHWATKRHRTVVLPFTDWMVEPRRLAGGHHGKGRHRGGIGSE